MTTDFFFEKLFRVNATVMRWAGLDHAELDFVWSSQRHGEIVRPSVACAVLGLIATMIAALYVASAGRPPILGNAFFYAPAITVPIGLVVIWLLGRHPKVGRDLAFVIGYGVWPVTCALMVISKIGPIAFIAFAAINLNLILLLAAPRWRQLSLRGRALQMWIEALVSRALVILLLTAVLWQAHGQTVFYLLVFIAATAHIIVYVPFSNLSAVLAGKTDKNEADFKRAQSLLLACLAIWPLWLADRRGFFLGGARRPSSWDCRNGDSSEDKANRASPS